MTIQELIHSMDCVLESDERTLSNPYSEKGWVYDAIREWLKTLDAVISDDDVDIVGIPKDATNYDMMKAVFGREVAVDLSNELSMGKSWWNAPYERGKE